MKILPVRNQKFSFTAFSATGSDYPGYKYYPPKKDNNQPEQNYTGWKHNNYFRKGVLGSLILWTLSSEPVVQDFFKSSSEKAEEKARTEYFEDVAELNHSSPMHHLNVVADVDMARIQKFDMGYMLDINFDDGKEVNFILDTPISKGDTLTGYLLENNKDFRRFEAVFSKEVPDNFQVTIYGKNKKKNIFVRDSEGYLYEIIDGKKKVINSENVEKYQKKLENLQTLEDWKFFTDKNPLWRHLNYILLIYLLLRERSYDIRRAKYEHKHELRV